MPVNPIVQNYLDMPLGSRELQHEAEEAIIRRRAGVKVDTTSLKKLTKRIAKKWTPLGKAGFNAREAAQAEKAAKALNYDIEDAIEQAGGTRGTCSK